MLLGFGRVGRALAASSFTTSAAVPIRIVGLLDRSGYVFDPKGLSRARLLRLAEAKDQGALLSRLCGRSATAMDALACIAAHAVNDPSIVDVTSEETGSVIASALEVICSRLVLYLSAIDNRTRGNPGMPRRSSGG